jgi:hypothetical protein
MIFLVVSLIIFLLWYSFGRFSDDTSAIESFHSVESNDAEVQEEVARKSESMSMHLR